MKERLLEILACPNCLKDLTCYSEKIENQNIVTGQLNCQYCQKTYPIIRGIPRFVSSHNYSASFGFQWNIFKRTQVDSFSGLSASHDRLTNETGWNLNALQDQWILDGGCGNGRFVDVISHSMADVVGVDLSSAIDAASELFKMRQNVHLVQASLLQLPFKKHAFDKCYCIGVIQHTPNPEKVIRELPRILKQGGKLALTIYEKRKYTLWNAKYFFRHLTKRANKKLLLILIKCIAPILFPLTEALYRIPKLGKFFQFIIPFANYVQDSRLNWRERYEWAILDTFDMLSPAYDLPQEQSAVETYLVESKMAHIERMPNAGLNIVATKIG